MLGVVRTGSKFFAPAVGLVRRAGLVSRVIQATPRVVTVTAPAGYGKSTFTAELADLDPRPAAWITMADDDNDPAVLLSDVALAIDPIEAVDPAVVRELWSSTPTIGSRAVRSFSAEFARRQQPMTVVFDDIHRLVSRDALDVLATLVDELPQESTVVLSGRTAVPIRLGRLRVRHRVFEVVADDLAFGVEETARLFGALHMSVALPELPRLVDRTEGWPVALYLAVLARELRGTGVIDDFSGDQRFLVDYLTEEMLDTVDENTASFMMDASCLDRVSGDLCDAVLQRQGSASMLDDLHQRLLLVIALDDRRQWYRFHHLLAEFLQSRLLRLDPTRPAEINRRASEWCNERGDPEGAVSYAARSGDYDLTEAMVMRWWGTVATASGARPTSDRWVWLFPGHELDRRPLLMVNAAWGRFASGQAGRALAWLERAAQALPERYPEEVHGLVAPVAYAVARAIIAPISPADMAAEATYAYNHVGRGEGHPLSCLALGAAAFMTDDEAAATRWLSEGADTTLQRPLIVANCLAHLAVIHIEHGQWPQAASLARRARAMIGGAAVFASMSLVLATSVLVDTHARRADDTEQDRLLCRQHLIDLHGASPWLTLQAHLALARTALLRGDRIEARALVDAAVAILAGVDGAVRVADQLQALSREVARHGSAHSHGPTSLTTAELRVLQLLPTHLSMAEIGDRLYVSRNTVKSQAIAIYRKLGASSRGAAVQAAAAAGLLGPALAGG